jgi:hypothetical protein
MLDAQAQGVPALRVMVCTNKHLVGPMVVWGRRQLMSNLMIWPVGPPRFLAGMTLQLET